MGLVIIGILNGSITTALTSFTIDLNFDIYGKKVKNTKSSYDLAGAFRAFNFKLKALKAPVVK